MPRLFTGLEIPPDIALQLSMHRSALSGARWVEPSDYHVTLRFLGDIDRHTARDQQRRECDRRGTAPLDPGRPANVHQRGARLGHLVDEIVIPSSTR